jgi:hypothetical protein
MIFSNSILNQQFLHRVRQAAIKATPKDTGNLAYNALVVQPTNEGFTVRYKSSVAGYGVFLNDYRKLRGFAENKLNPHYLWFDNGVHSNIVNEMVRSFTKSKPPKKDKIIEPTARTYEDSSIAKKLTANDGNQMAKENRNINLQYQTFKDWNSRFDQFKNHNGKGWGI